MSECGGAHTLSNPTDENVAGVGKTLKGVKSKIDKPDKDGNGEVNIKFCFTFFYLFLYFIIHMSN
jgi:long-subunit acyl-CoA synthetase (AMP-forming)